MRILLIAPEFFSYSIAIRKKLNDRGVYTLLANELYSSNLFTKIIYRMKLFFLSKKKIVRHKEELLNTVIQNRISDLIFISPDHIDASFLLKLRSKARLHLFMWDGFRNKPAARNYLSHFNTISSFDNEDCEKYRMNYIPLFAEDVFKYQLEEKVYDVSFCGTLHSNRPKFIRYLIGYFGNNNIYFKTKLYYHSKFLFYLFNPLTAYFFSRKISTNPFSKQEVAELFKRSKVILDITHPRQNGLTSRTFEALRSNSKLITNNVKISEIQDIFPGRIFTYNPNSNFNSFKNFLTGEISSLTKKQDYFLSIDRFLDQLLRVVND